MPDDPSLQSETAAQPQRAVVEKRGNLWHVVVLYDDHKVAVVARYPARYKAQEHADGINGEHVDPSTYEPERDVNVDLPVADGTPEGGER